MYNLGIDLGGTFVKAGVVDAQNKVVCKTSVPTMVDDGNDAVVDNIVKACMTALEEAGLKIDDVANVGIGCPGAVNTDTGTVEISGNLKMRNFRIAEKLESKLGRKVYIGNDANAAALGELVAGAAKGAKDAVCVTLGTGVGGGVIIGGRLYSGTNFAGGELGHTVIIMDGEQCNCGRKGCWERYASVTALIRQTKAAMEENRDSKMWEIAGSLDNVDGKTSFDAMRMGDETGKAVVAQYIRYVACGVTDMVNIFQPDVLCIGGGISKEGDALLAPLYDIVVKERFTKESDKQTKIVAATLGNDAGLIGAANLYTEH